MSFEHPWILILLALPLAAWIAGYIRPGGRVEYPARFQEAASDGLATIAIRLAEAVRYAMVGVIIVLLAGPEKTMQGDVVREMRNIHFLVDSSGSMSIPFGKGRTRHEAAFDEVEHFVKGRKDDAFAMSIFGQEVVTWVPLTRDTVVIPQCRPFLAMESLPMWLKQSTNTGLAIEETCRQLRDSQAGDRMIILITDGISGDISGPRSEQLIRIMRESRTKLFTILTADESTAAICRELSRGSGGELFFAGDADGLKQVFKEIDQMSMSPMKPSGLNHSDWYFPVASVGLALVSVQVLLTFFLRATPW